MRTVTFLFTDIESSTQRWHDDRDGMAVALAEHDALLTRVVEAHDGRVFKHTGDGVCSVFESAGQAVAAASEAQRLLQLPVRMGIHTGEAEARDGDFYGTTLNRCARIMDAGHGGQILVSALTYTLTGEVGGMDLGDHELKGLPEKERIFQIGDSAFPALRLQSSAFALPSMLTSLVGRDELVTRIIDQLAEARLVTLIGVGGVGKTRVAIAVADQVAADHEMTVFVDLSEVDGDGDVLPALARSLSLRTPTMESVAIAMSSRRVMVVLDNCEHVVDVAADLAENLLAISPSSKVLATSREGLGSAGEHIIAVPGLGGPASESAAVALFVDRARSADASFVVAADDVEVIAEICGRLDGIPLAIELAAARATLMTLGDLLDRLDARFQVLTGGRRRRSRSRGRTLRETVDWSYELLDDHERRAFSRLSVFGGSFGLDGASAVLGRIDDVEALDLVETLVDKSLLTVVDVEGYRRYRFLETLRLYARERLDETGEGEQALSLLREHLTAVVAEAVDDMFESSADGSRLRVEVPNLRRAFEDALDHGDLEAATAIIAPFGDIVGDIDWPINGWADEALALPEASGSTFEPLLLALQAVDTWLGRRFGTLRDSADEIVRLSSALGEIPFGVGETAAFLYRLTGDDQQADRLYRETADDADPNRALRARLYSHWSKFIPAQLGSAVALDDSAEVDLVAARDHPSRLLRARASQVEAFITYSTGDYPRMRTMARQSQDLSTIGAAHWFAAVQIEAWAEWQLGEFDSAVRVADMDLEHAYRFGDRSAMVIPIMIYALVLQTFEEAEAAATLRGWLPRRLTVLLVAELRELDRWLATQLAPDDRRRLATRGSSMAPRELQRLTHDVLSEHIELHDETTSDTPPGQLPEAATRT